MQDTLDLNDLLLEATAELQEIVGEVMQELLEPQMLSALRLQWHTLPDDTKEALKQKNPVEYRRLIQMLEG